MAYCKRCQCGHVLIYDHMGGAPLLCPKCTRFIAAIAEEVYQEPEHIEQEAKNPEPECPTSSIDPAELPLPIAAEKNFRITLESPDGELILPVTEQMDVGRNAAGKEYLGNFIDVTREHFTIAPRANGITATLTDHSTFGTYINGVRMIKESSVVVSNFSEIRLASKAVLLVCVREVNKDA